MYQLQGSGLDNIYLKDGFTIRETRYGNGVSFKDIEGLYSAISLSVCTGDFLLTPEAFRFLRKRLDFSQEQLGLELGCTDQAVAKWEKGETAIPIAASRLIRALTMKSLFPNRLISDSIAELSNKKMGDLSFTYSASGWTSVSDKSNKLTVLDWNQEFIAKAQLEIVGSFNNITYINCNDHNYNQYSKEENEPQSIAA